MDATTPGKAQHADPYVVFQVLVGGQVFSAARTKHVLNAANPAWDDILELPLPVPAGLAAPPPLVLRLRLMDKDFSTADDPIARFAAQIVCAWPLSRNSGARYQPAQLRSVGIRATNFRAAASPQ